MFHSNHYDWWMFPIDDPSSYSFAYTIYDEEIAELKQDDGFIEGYLSGVKLLALAWGWDLDQQEYIPNPDPNQTWHDWPIRLYKAAKSVKLFGFNTEFESLRSYARDLISQGKSMIYSGRNLSDLFR